MTPTPARRSADCILCGRQVDGRYFCQGELARAGVNGTVNLGPGMVEDPPGHWRRTNRAARRIAEGRGVYGMAQRRGWLGRTPRRAAASLPVALPITMDCPRCGSPAILQADLL